MIGKMIVVDLTNVRTPLGARQTVAAAFGVPLGQEFTWDLLRPLVRDAVHTAAPNHMRVCGLPKLGVVLPEEATMFRSFLRDLRSWLPSLDIRIVLHD